MIARDIQKELTQSSREYPVICITGPRQSGKTTLSRSAFSKLPYVSFEEPIIRDTFKEDPKGFLHRFRGGAVFDEVQHVPDLFSYLQVLVDENPEPGRFVLTGSQHFGLTERISQSLAGRTAMLELLPFNAAELKRGDWLVSDLDQLLFNGSYPPVHDRGFRPHRWYANYLATYIQRDVRQVSQVHDLDVFTRFMRLCAGSTGQLLNTNRLGTECGIDHKTIRRWFTILQASYLVGLLPPYYKNFRKRVIKSPKVYFFDTGLACHLLGIQTPEQLSTHPLRGALFESWVFSELTKEMVNCGRIPELYFWRTHSGQEIDFVLEYQGRVHLIECKSGMTVAPAGLMHLHKAHHLWEEAILNRWVIYGGSDEMQIHDCTIRPWNRIGSIFSEKQ